MDPPKFYAMGIINHHMKTDPQGTQTQILCISPLLTHTPLSHWILLTKHQFQDKSLRISRWQQEGIKPAGETLLSVAPYVLQLHAREARPRSASSGPRHDFPFRQPRLIISLNHLRYQTRNTQPTTPKYQIHRTTKDNKYLLWTNN